MAVVGAIAGAAVLAMAAAIIVPGGGGPGGTSTPAFPTSIATPVPTLTAAFLADHGWALKTADFASSNTFLALTPKDVQDGGGAISFATEADGLGAKWSLVASGTPVTCYGNVLEGDQIEPYKIDYIPGYLDPSESSVRTALCGLGQPPFSLTVQQVGTGVLPSWELTMTNPSQTSFVWAASSFLLPSTRSPSPP